MEDLLYLMPHTLLGETAVHCECWCSHLGVVSALTTLPRAELQSMTDDGSPLDINCDYCRREYRVPLVELQGLLTES
jgi:molecular chaperone Hsp33